MKEIVKKTIVEHEEIVFEATDGTIFHREADCLYYESELARKAILNRDDIVIGEEANGFAPFNGGENYESHDYLWFKPLTPEGATALHEAFPPVNAGIDAMSMVGEWVCIEDLSDGYFYTWLGDDIDYVRNLCSRLGYEVSFQPKKKTI